MDGEFSSSPPLASSAPAESDSDDEPYVDTIARPLVDAAAAAPAAPLANLAESDSDEQEEEDSEETDGEGEHEYYVLGSRPYMFEPRVRPRPPAAGEAAAAGAVEEDRSPSSTASSAESDSDEQQDSEEEEDELRVRPLARPPAANMNDGGGGEAAAAAPPSWCTCGHCQDMDDPKQRLCCKDVDRVMEKCAETESQPTCITLHPGFANCCLNPWVQQAQLADIVHHYGHFDHNLSLEERYRRTAYRSFVIWCWGFVGRNVHIAVPSCAVNKIRAAYRSQAETGTGLPPLEIP